MTDARPHPLVAAILHDGYYSCGTGAGRSNRAFLETLVGMLLPGVRLLVLPIHLTLGSSEYNAPWHAEMQTLIQHAEGQIIPISNGTHGTIRFGGLAQFKAACASAATVISNYPQAPGGPLLIIAFDAPFYGLAPLLTLAARGCLVNVARSTALLHDPGDRSRVQWERGGLQAVVAGGARVAAISAHMRCHLARQYAIPSRALLDLPNGLTTADWKPAAPAARLLPAPARRGFVLAMGRAVPYKGFDDLIDALTLLKNAAISVPHAVIAAVTDGSQHTPYQQHLARRIADAGLNATLLTRFDPQLRGLLSHPALAAVIVPSRAEPFGRIPLEAFAVGATPVVATTAGGLPELVIDGLTGYTAQPGHPVSLAAAISRALACDAAERARLRAGSRRLATTCYNHEQAVAAFCAEVAPWAVITSKQGRQASRDGNSASQSG